jgi:hypothetical protein
MLVDRLNYLFVFYSDNVIKAQLQNVYNQKYRKNIIELSQCIY